MYSWYLLVSAAVFCGLLQTVCAITCYDCSSVTNSACLDMVTYGRADLIPLVDCDKHLASRRNLTKSNKLFCRKIVQTILRNNKEAEVRVTRGCGWVPHGKPCYKADTGDHLETVCQCHGDRCNAAAPHHAPALRAAAAAAAAAAAPLLLTILTHA